METQLKMHLRNCGWWKIERQLIITSHHTIDMQVCREEYITNCNRYQSERGTNLRKSIKISFNWHQRCCCIALEKSLRTNNNKKNAQQCRCQCYQLINIIKLRRKKTSTEMRSLKIKIQTFRKQLLSLSSVRFIASV